MKAPPKPKYKLGDQLWVVELAARSVYNSKIDLIKTEVSYGEHLYYLSGLTAYFEEDRMFDCYEDAAKFIVENYRKGLSY